VQQFSQGSSTPVPFNSYSQPQMQSNPVAVQQNASQVVMPDQFTVVMYRTPCGDMVYPVLQDNRPVEPVNPFFGSVPGAVNSFALPMVGSQTQGNHCQNVDYRPQQSRMVPVVFPTPAPIYPISMPDQGMPLSAMPDQSVPLSPITDYTFHLLPSPLTGITNVVSPASPEVQMPVFSLHATNHHPLQHAAFPNVPMNDVPTPQYYAPSASVTPPPQAEKTFLNKRNPPGFNNRKTQTKLSPKARKPLQNRTENSKSPRRCKAKRKIKKQAKKVAEGLRVHMKNLSASSSGDEAIYDSGDDRDSRRNSVESVRSRKQEPVGYFELEEELDIQLFTEKQKEDLAEKLAESGSKASILVTSEGKVIAFHKSRARKGRLCYNEANSKCLYTITSRNGEKEECLMKVRVLWKNLDIIQMSFFDDRHKESIGFEKGMELEKHTDRSGLTQATIEQIKDIVGDHDIEFELGGCIRELSK